MDEKEKKELQQTVLDAIATSLEAQLRAVRRLGSSPPSVRKKKPAESRSQVDLVFDILTRSGGELHISEIIARVHKVHGVQLDRESIVSALTKKVQRGDRFTRPDRNVFGLVGKGAR